MKAGEDEGEEGEEEGEDEEAREGSLLVKDHRVFNGPLGRSLCSFTRFAHSAHSLCSAPFCYALFTGSLIHFARSLV